MSTSLPASLDWCLPVSPAQREAAAAYLAQARQQALAGAEWPAAPPAHEDRSVAVLGAGTMGCGIVLAALAAGYPTRLLDVNAEALQRGVERIRASLEGAVQRGKLAPDERDARLARLQPGTDWAALADVDVVIEAVYENLAVKQ